MKWKGALSSVVAATLLLTLTAGATQLPDTIADQNPENGLTTTADTARFADIEGHWAQAAIERWADYGVIKGYEDGTNFAPSNSITRAEMAALLSRILNWEQKADSSVFQDISGSEWYADDILKAYFAGVMTGDGQGNALPTDPITRQDAATMISRAFHISTSETATQFGDHSEISSWAVEAVNGMTERGYIIGGTDGNFGPWRSITRAETVTILDRIVVKYYNQAGSYSEDVTGIVVVAVTGVTLTDMTVDGDLFIVSGATESDVLLENVTVTGQVYAAADLIVTPSPDPTPAPGDEDSNDGDSDGEGSNGGDSNDGDSNDEGSNGDFTVSADGVQPK